MDRSSLQDAIQRNKKKMQKQKESAINAVVSLINIYFIQNTSTSYVESNHDDYHRIYSTVYSLLDSPMVYNKKPTKQTKINDSNIDDSLFSPLKPVVHSLFLFHSRHLLSLKTILLLKILKEIVSYSEKEKWMNYIKEN